MKVKTSDLTQIIAQASYRFAVFLGLAERMRIFFYGVI
jgi:hypothetical protein